MKISISILSFFVSLNVFASALNCSQNGTNVYYINGVLAKSSKDTDEDSAQIDFIFKGSRNLLDSKSNVAFIPIYNPSNDVLNDVAELYAEDYFYRTGKDDGFSVFMQIYRAKLYRASHPSFLKKLTQGSYLQTLRYKANRLKAIAVKEKYETSAMGIEQLKKANAEVVNTVISNIDDSIRGSKKALFVAHSQGNAVLKEAFRRSSNNSSDYQDYLKRFIGVLHVASPVQNLPTSTTNVRSYLLSNDWIVNIATEIFPEFNKSPATHTIVSSSASENSKGFDEFNHQFSQVYLTPNANASNGISVKDMRTIFKETLSDLATDLESNCDKSTLSSTKLLQSKTLATTFDYIGYTTAGNIANIDIIPYHDTNSDGKSDYVTDPIKPINYNWTVTSSNYDANEIYSGTSGQINFPISYSGDYFITAKQVLNGGTSVEEKFTVKIEDKAPTDVNVNFFCDISQNRFLTYYTVDVTDSDSKSGYLRFEEYHQDGMDTVVYLSGKVDLIHYSKNTSGALTGAGAFNGRGYDIYFVNSKGVKTFIKKAMMPDSMFCHLL